MPLRQAIEGMTYGLEPTVSDVAMRRLCARVDGAIERAWARREVSQGQNRFRLVYGTTVCFEESHAGADCQFINEPHFHRRVKRIGHLPMFTVKELPL